MKQYTLTISESQARVIADACDCYMRLMMGQLRYVADYAGAAMEGRFDDMMRLKDAFERLEPLVSGRPPNGYRGIFNETLPTRAHLAHDIYSVVRHRLAWDKNPEGGMGVQYDPPLKAAQEPLPAIESREVPLT